MCGGILKELDRQAGQEGFDRTEVVLTVQDGTGQDRSTFNCAGKDRTGQEQF
jgi:hypothetical protein